MGSGFRTEDRLWVRILVGVEGGVAGGEAEPPAGRELGE